MFMGRKVNTYGAKVYVYGVSAIQERKVIGFKAKTTPKTACYFP